MKNNPKRELKNSTTVRKAKLFIDNARVFISIRKTNNTRNPKTECNIILNEDLLYTIRLRIFTDL